ncbi:MAG: flagellar protein G [Candidatus Methanoperedens sp.]|nr:flagellar protein G [Candidatus Methanoperedens sp.]
MGAGTSATHIIFFIVSVVVALGVVGALYANIQPLTSAANVGSKTLSEQLRTDITVINDPELIPFSDGNYTFYVKNTGREDLPNVDLSVLINGIIIPDSSVTKTILSGNIMWRAGDVMEIKVATALGTGSHTLRIITYNGIEDSFRFRI